MASRGASVIISIEKKEGGKSLVVRPFGGEPLRPWEALDAGGVREQLLELRDLEKTFVETFGDPAKEITWGEISQAMQALHRQGLTLASQLFKDRCWEVQALLSKMMPFPALNSTSPKLIQVIAPPESSIPIEFLPLFRLKPLPEITDIRSLREAASSFISFSAIVKRTQPEGEPFSTDPVLDNEPKLPVKFFHHVKFEGARKEAEFFRQYSDYVDLEGPWPDREIPQEQVSRQLAEHLWNPVPRFDGSQRTPPDQVQHFSCHCDSTSARPTKHFLQLAHCKGVEREVTVGELQAHFASFQDISTRQERIAFPLVFLNACGTSVYDPMRIGSFLNLLLDIRNRGVIGTQCAIPDDFAASFSEQFYRALLRGSPLGDAIHYAKWQMLERHNNPLGILYTVYADPDMHIRNIMS